MYQNLKESIADLCKYEAQKGGALYIGIEPKPNEGHPAMLLPTVASALLLFPPAGGGVWYLPGEERG